MIIRSKIRTKFCGEFLHKSLNWAAFHARPPVKDSCKVPCAATLEKQNNVSQETTGCETEKTLLSICFQREVAE